MVLDQLLLRTNQWSPIDGYGVRIPLAFLSASPLTGDVLEDNERIRRTGSRFRKVSNTILLKLHGSLNWGTRYVPSASGAASVELETGGAVLEAGAPLLASFANSMHGYNLASRVSVSHFWRPFIVPPNVIEAPLNTSQAFLREIWYLARCVLTSTDEIHVLGYSLPPSDFEAGALLREGLFARSPGVREKRVIIVNKDDNVLRRFERFSRPGVVRIEASPKTDARDHLRAFIATRTRSP